MYVCIDGDWVCTGPPSLGPPNPSRRLAGVRIGVAGVVSSSSKSTNRPEVDTAAAALDDPDFVTGGNAVIASGRDVNS